MEIWRARAKRGGRKWVEQDVASTISRASRQKGRAKEERPGTPGEIAGRDGPEKAESTRETAAPLTLPPDVATFSHEVLGRALRPYQEEVAAAIQASVLESKGLTFTVMRGHGNPERGSTPPSEAAEFWKEVELVRPVMRSGGQLGFAVPAAQGHDDFVAMLALLAWAAREVRPAPAHVLLPPRALYEGRGRY